MLCVCVVDVMVLVYGKCECFVMHMLYVCALCVSCGNVVKLRPDPGMS